jgi:hypothetical protein
MFLEHSIHRCAAARWCLGLGELSRLLPHYHQDANIDRASQVLGQGVPPGVPTLYRALADHHDNVSHSILYYRARRRPSREKKAQGQQYLKPYKKKVLVKYLLKMSDLGYPIRIKFIPSLAYSVTRH